MSPHPTRTASSPEVALGTRLQRLVLDCLAERGETPSDLARALGISRQRVHEQLHQDLTRRGTHVMTFVTLARYAEALGCEVEVRLVPRAPVEP